MTENVSKKAAAKKKPRGRPFRPGESGNPAGMPPMSEEKKQARREVREILKAAAPDAAALLLRIMKDENAKPELRLRCAESVIDRVYGRASQPIEGLSGSELHIIIEGDMALSE